MYTLNELSRRFPINGIERVIKCNDHQSCTNVMLAPHQRAMLSRCLEIEAHVRNGSEKRKCAYMNDAPGSGKTYVAIALACVSSETSLFSVPTHILPQWINEIDTLGCTDYFFVISSLNDLINVEKTLTTFISKKQQDQNITDDTTIPFNQYSSIFESTSNRRHFLTSHILLDSVMSMLYRMSEIDSLCHALDQSKYKHLPMIERIIVDEPQCSPYIDIGQHRKHTNIMWQVSATPDVSPPDAMCVRCTPIFVEVSFQVPEPENWYIPCQDKAITDVLSKFHIEYDNAEMALQCEAHDFDGARTPIQKINDIHKQLKDTYNTSDAMLCDINANRRYIPPDVKKNAKQKHADAKHKLDNFEQLMLQWSKSINEIEQPHVVNSLDKPSKLRSMLNGQIGDDGTLKNRVVIFTLFSPTPILNVLEECHVQYTMDVLKFSQRNDETRVLVLDPSLITGLNLPFVTDIVFWHRVPVVLATQVIGRAQRMGRNQTSALRVYSMGYNHT